jgi:hypothetical protein
MVTTAELQLCVAISNAHYGFSWWRKRLLTTPKVKSLRVLGMEMLQLHEAKEIPSGSRRRIKRALSANLKFVDTLCDTAPYALRFQDYINEFWCNQGNVSIDGFLNYLVTNPDGLQAACWELYNKITKTVDYLESPSPKVESKSTVSEV